MKSIFPSAAEAVRQFIANVPRNTAIWYYYNTYSVTRRHPIVRTTTELSWKKPSATRREILEICRVERPISRYCGTEIEVLFIFFLSNRIAVRPARSTTIR